MKNYKIWDCQLECYNEDLGSFETEQEALKTYGEQLRKQNTQRASDLSNKGLFELYGYEVHNINYKTKGELKMTTKQTKLNTLSEDIYFNATNRDIMAMVHCLYKHALDCNLESKPTIINAFLENLKTVKTEDLFTLKVYELIDEYADVLENWKEDLTVQQLIDELLSVENKDLLVRFYNDSDDIINLEDCAYITNVNELNDVVELGCGIN